MLSTHACVVMVMFFYLLPILLHLFKNHCAYHTFDTHLIILICINNMIFHSFFHLFVPKSIFWCDTHFCFVWRQLHSFLVYQMNILFLRH